MQQTQITPFFDNIIVQQEKLSDRTSGGIIVPEKNRSMLNKGKVLDKGPQVSDQIQVGMVVFWQLHAESKFEHGGVHFSTIKESDVVGKFEVVEKPIEIHVDSLSS